MQTTIKILKALAGGIVIFPLMVAAFFIDRVILVFIPHVQGPKIKDIFDNLKFFIPIMYRVGFVFCSLLLAGLFRWLFW